jgi:hypothetical protein
MSKKPCPICQDPIDRTARTVTVGGVAYDVCCEECAQQAQANPTCSGRLVALEHLEVLAVAALHGDEVAVVEP